MASKKKEVKSKSHSKKNDNKNKSEKKSVSKKASPKKPAPKPKPAKGKSSSSKKIIIKKASPKKPEPKKPIVKKKIEPKKVLKVSKSNLKVQKKASGKLQKTIKVTKPEKKVVETKHAPSKPLHKEKHHSKESTAKQLVKEVINETKVKVDRSKDVLAVSNTIPVIAKAEISASKIASISSSITNPVKRADSYSVKVDKEPNGKFEMEFVVHASADMLYEFLSTPSGLSEWFCDDLNIRNGIYTFIWEDQMSQARLLKTVDLVLVRFQWVDKLDGSYFELKIQKDDLTNDISLIVTDFAETVADRESSKLLWNSQIEKLMHVIGSIF